MDYEKIRHDIDERQDELALRARDLEEQRKRLDQEGDKINREMIGLLKVRLGLEYATSEEEPPPPPVLGQAQQVKKILSQTPTPLTPPEIRDSCYAAGVRSSSRRMLLTGVHNVLRRLEWDVKKVRLDGTTAYIMRASLGNQSKRSH
jgi:hypothetical protein